TAPSSPRRRRCGRCCGWWWSRAAPPPSPRCCRAFTGQRRARRSGCFCAAPIPARSASPRRSDARTCDGLPPEPSPASRRGRRAGAGRPPPERHRMIDRRLLPLVKAALTPPARALARRGVPAERVTLAGFGIGVLALPALALGLWWVALALILLNRIGDGLDGTLARLTAPTDRGAFMDIALGFGFFALVPPGFALADPAANALPGAAPPAGFLGSGTSFLAFPVVAERRRLTPQAMPGGIA